MSYSFQLFWLKYRPYIILGAIIFIISVIVYSPGFGASFVWDDEEQILANVAVQSLSQIPNLFTGSTFNSGGASGLTGVYYKPMMTVIFTILYSISGPNPLIFHAFQIIIHAISSIFVFLSFELILSTQIVKKKLQVNKQITIISFISALIFAVHPMNVETVVYISALQDALFFFFGIGAFYLVLQYVRLIRGSERSYLNIYSLVLLFALLLSSLLSKETGILFIIVIPIYLLFITDIKRKQVYPLIYIVIAVFIMYLFLRIGVAQVGLMKNNISPIAVISTVGRIQSIPKIITFYLTNSIFPRDLLIAQHWVVGTISLKDFFTPLLLVLTCLATTIYVLFRIRSRILTFFFVWVAIGFGLHAQIFPLDMTVADRWFYFPLFGIVGFVSYLIYYLGLHYYSTRKYQYIFLTITIVLIIGFGVRSFVRSAQWKDGLTLFDHDGKINTEAYDLQNNYGVELYRVGRFDEALIQFEKSIKIAPTWSTNWNNAGAIYERYKDLPKAETYYKKAIDNGVYYLAYENYLNILIKQNKLQEAKEFAKQALQILPNNSRISEMNAYLNSFDNPPQNPSIFLNTPR